MSKYVSTMVLGAATALYFSATQADGQQPATLVGHAVLPAESFIDAPDDAPAALHVSGKFTRDSIRSHASFSSGTTLPFKGQPLQGFSGISHIEGNQYYVLSDNGFGSKANSPDAMLFFHRLDVNFNSGDVIVKNTTFLNDPDKIIPFVISMEGSESRYLTGSDLDIEGFQVIGW